VARAVQLIQARYGEPLTVAAIARGAGVSRTVLGERFASCLGEPPIRYCTRWRLQRAAELLLEGHALVDVAYQVGFNSEAAFNRAFKREHGAPPAAWRRSRKNPPALPAQQVRHCTASDGTRLAWSAVGSGPPLVKTANWLNHISFEWESPLWRHWLLALARDNQLIRYDERGNGLSDWDTPCFSLGAFVEDLETVVEAAGVDRFDLLGISQGAAVAIAYSIRNPGRIRKMVLLGGYARGWALRLTGEELEGREAMITLSRTGWGNDNPAFRQMFTALYIPGGSAEQADWFNEMQRVSTSPANAERLQRVLGTIDVSQLRPRVTVPTLIAHARRDHVIPFAAGEELARGIPGARFVELDSENHILLESEPAWRDFLAAMRDFLAR
jgi:pimeloyl-ACP methyl ester carboxylesterase/AraC-like DNA-binding protein